MATVPYDAAAAGRQARQRLRQPRRPRKLRLLGSLHRRHRPAASRAGRHNRFKADCVNAILTIQTITSHETIYATIYATPRGELRKDLIRCLRQAMTAGANAARAKTSAAACRIWSAFTSARLGRGRLVPGHWEADLIKGAGNRSAVATLVERTSRLVMLAKMPDASAASALEALTAMLNRIPEPSLRQTLTYDQGREMTGTKADRAHGRSGVLC